MLDNFHAFHTLDIYLNVSMSLLGTAYMLTSYCWQFTSLTGGPAWVWWWGPWCRGADTWCLLLCLLHPHQWGRGSATLKQRWGRESATLYWSVPGQTHCSTRGLLSNLVVTHSLQNLFAEDQVFSTTVKHARFSSNRTVGQQCFI